MFMSPLIAMKVTCSKALKEFIKTPLTKESVTTLWIIHETPINVVHRDHFFSRK